MTVDEILDAMPDEDAATGRDYLVIDPVARTITVPESEKVFGVTGDDIADRKYFICPRYVGDNLDLAGMFIRVNYRNAGGDEDGYLVDDVTVSGNYVTFSWRLWPKVTEYKGPIQFGVCADLPNTTERRFPDWNTTMATGEVLEGLHPYDGDVEEETRDVVTQLRDMVTVQTGNVEAVGAAQVQAVRAASIIATAEAQAQIEAKGAATLATIPADYTTLANKTNEQANAIKGHLSGEIVQATDVSLVEHYLAVTVHSKNIIPFPYYHSSMTQAGVEITVAEDGTVTFNGTALEDSAFRFIKNASIPVKGEYTLSGCANGSNSTYYVQPFIDDVGVITVQDGARTYEWDGNLTSLALFFKAGTAFDNFQIKPQLEEGTAATEYVPYIDPAGVTVSRCGKNLIDYKTPVLSYSIESTEVNNGLHLAGRYMVSFPVNLPAGVTVVMKWDTSNMEGTVSDAWRLQYADTSYSGHADNGEAMQADLPVAQVLLYLNKGTADGAADFTNIQLELGATPTAYVPHSGATAMPAADGTVTGLPSAAPTMTLLADTAGVTIDCTYNRDSNAVYAELLAKIAALGGTI